MLNFWQKTNCRPRRFPDNVSLIDFTFESTARSEYEIELSLTMSYSYPQYTPPEVRRCIKQLQLITGRGRKTRTFRKTMLQCSENESNWVKENPKKEKIMMLKKEETKGNNAASCTPSYALGRKKTCVHTTTIVEQKHIRIICRLPVSRTRQSALEKLKAPDRKLSNCPCIHTCRGFCNVNSSLPPLDTSHCSAITCKAPC